MIESGFLSLKVTTWTKQYNAAAHRDIPAMNELSDWLTSNLPATDNEVTLVHGDFRLDNLIFHPTEVWVLEQPPFQIFSWMWCFTKLRVMPPDTRDSSVGLGAVYHWAAPGRPGLLPYVPLLACEPSPPLYGQPERNRRWWEQILAVNSIILQKIHFVFDHVLYLFPFLFFLFYLLVQQTSRHPNRG